MAMKRLLGILNMNPEVDRNTWDHSEVRYFDCLIKATLRTIVYFTEL
jgi:hypothetical protein